jgi:hypothetical protein
VAVGGNVMGVCGSGQGSCVGLCCVVMCVLCCVVLCCVWLCCVVLCCVGGVDRLQWAECAQRLFDHPVLCYTMLHNFTLCYI